MALYTSLPGLCRGTFRLCIRYRMLSSYKEIEIPVPWGIISGKAWGKEDGRRVLGLHGWLHNANTFDRLVPHLPDDLYFVCIDLPGHGKSSHKPPGSIYGGFERILDIARVTSHLGWQNFYIIGHSLGGALALAYAGMFPNHVKKILTFDTYGLQTKTPQEAYTSMQWRIPRLLKTYGPVKVFPSAEAAAKRMVEEDSDLDLDSARILVERGVKDVDGGVSFALDYALMTLNLDSFTMSEELLAYFHSKIKSSVLYILGSQSKYAKFEVIRKRRSKYMINSPYVDAVFVGGNHNLHLSNPEVAVGYMNNFLTESANSCTKSML